MKNQFQCIDCKRDTLKLGEYYMVKNTVWNKAGNPNGMLCVHCIEIRIDRRLKPGDFTHCPANLIEPIPFMTISQKSETLLNRLGADTQQIKSIKKREPLFGL